MDIQMPIINGLNATRAIREELGLDTPPVIVLTAVVLAEERQNNLYAGINYFQPTPGPDGGDDRLVLPVIKVSHR